MLKRCIYIFGPFFLLLAMFASLNNLGFIDVTKISAYELDGISSLTDKMRYYASVCNQSANDFSLPNINYVTPIGVSSWMFESLIQGLQTIVRSIIRLGSFLLLGGSVLFDFLNDLVAILRYFVNFMYSSDKTGGFWSIIWKSW